jgi:hypothetical protein
MADTWRHVESTHVCSTLIALELGVLADSCKRLVVVQALESHFILSH